MSNGTNVLLENKPINISTELWGHPGLHANSVFFSLMNLTVLVVLFCFLLQHLTVNRLLKSIFAHFGPTWCQPLWPTDKPPFHNMGRMEKSEGFTPIKSIHSFHLSSSSSHVRCGYWYWLLRGRRLRHLRVSWVQTEDKRLSVSCWAGTDKPTAHLPLLSTSAGPCSVSLSFSPSTVLLSCCHLILCLHEENWPFATLLCQVFF